MNSTSWTTMIFFSCLLSVLCADARAQTTQTQYKSADSSSEDMMQVVNDAISLYQAGRYSEAIDKFQQAYAVKEDPNILFNIARCYHLQGDKANAVEYYRRFIDDLSVAPEARQRAESYLKQLETEPKSEVAATTGPAEPIPPEESAESAVNENKPSPEELSADEAEPGLENGNDETVNLRRNRVPGFALIGTGAAAVVAAGALYGVTLSKYNDFEESKNLNEKESLRNDTEVFALAGDICLGVGVVTTAVGIAVLLIKGRSEKPKANSAVYTSSWISQKGSGVTWSVRF